MNVNLCEFGEKVLFMPLKSGNGAASAEAWYRAGIWLGINERSSDSFIATEDGEVVGARSVKRLPEEDRWCRELVQANRGTPWNPSGSDAGPDVIFRERDPAETSAPLPVPRPELPVPRRVKLLWRDFDRHGYTDGCPGCRSSSSR